MDVALDDLRNDIMGGVAAAGDLARWTRCASPRWARRAASPSW